ncbi:N-acetylmuramoyl-L-alanine amidase [Pseudomonas alcaligenes]|uniref:N-acetylmuramoyl-L-alanine amidase n=1 Tax=Aquipseudomonas alcaligenes TaxID=43263 RepID=A0ABR7S5S6_AQUAC|nr:N-acetylmuramoyl-L-alanine amidase [Pseudomonas alcaligenes]MBC9252921.1 N-acetylmuramoyl-L-alanine amidase [Pseudomonas alcaligenes]
MRFVLLALTALLLSACAGGPQINDSLSARSQSSRVQYVVMHYTSTDLARSLALLSRGEVSSHYLIADDAPATIYRLVDENRRAWHAGQSEWQGRTWLNASTIGIEIVNQGYTETPTGQAWQPYSEAQIEALIVLLKDIVQRHQLPIDSIIGHSDIAPQRKTDPGPLFPWRRLAEAGLIRWPDAAEVAREQAALSERVPDAPWFQEQLARLGYSTPQSGQFDAATRKVLAAFQMKYRPARYDGVADAESAALLLVLNRMAH